MFAIRRSLVLIIALLFGELGGRALPATTALSSITRVDIAGTEAAGTFAGVPYTRTWGTVFGTVAPGERVAGLAALPKNASGAFEYSSQFELIAPAAGNVSGGTIVVEAENRGTPLLIGRLNSLSATGAPATVKYPAGMGNGFLFAHRMSYARVQWQTGISAGVPASAQGIGEVIVRDFGRWLSDRYTTRLLGGISQSGWFVETFVAEDFNVNPADGKAVYAGAIAVDGTGNWLALNQLAEAHHTPQQPYVDPANPQPLDARALLHHQAADPFFIDIANYTDFYRVHASLTDTTALPANMRRYDWPSPHALGSAASAANAFSTMGCNDRRDVRLNPIPYDAYLRALALELARRTGSPVAADAPPLPPSTLFALGPLPAQEGNFNPLAGAALRVPLVDGDAQPRGGVRFPEVENPIGKPVPVSLAPVITTTIANTCGNLGQWQPFSAGELTQRYTSQAEYVRRYAASVDRLITAGFLLPFDRLALLAQGAAFYANPAGY